MATMATMDESQSFDGRESEILFNPALLWTMQQFPKHTKGEVLFFMLPLDVRHRIVGKLMSQRVTFNPRLDVYLVRQLSKTYANPFTYRF